MEKKRTYGVWAVRSSTSIFGPAQSWCKENGKPLEFDTKAAAENYAKEANEHTTANVRYYVKEKEPEPGAVRKGTSQPELDARSHEEVIPRNDAAEKQNEIPGRQIPSQTDPLVEIRSAVHSNYAGMVAMLGADNRVYLGREEANAATTNFNTLSVQIKDLESRMNANAELQKQIVNYAKTRAVYVEYRKAGYSKKYRIVHEAEILLHQAAKNHFDELGIQKLPSVKSLREEYTDLLEQKRKAYSAYKQAKNDMKELHNVRANVEYLLEISSPPLPQRSTEKSRQ